MPVYKSSPERTRRLFGSGVIVARPPRQKGAQSNTRPKPEEKRSQRSSIDAAAGLYSPRNKWSSCGRSFWSVEQSSTTQIRLGIQNLTLMKEKI